MSFDLWLPRGPELHWQVLSVRGTEAISQPYEFEVELWCDDPDAELDQVLGADVELLLDRNGHERRVFGIVAEIEILFAAELRIQRDGIGARVRIVPAFRLLDQEIDTRFFAGQTVIEILAELLGGRLAAYERSLDVESRIKGEYNRRDYCVQFRESTFDFCSRIMEEEGVAYVFAHDPDAGSERMILVDQNEDYADVELLVPEPIAVELDRPDELDRESLQAFHWRHKPTANRVLARGYNYKLGNPIDEGEAEELGEPRPIVREQVHHAAQRQIIDDPVDDPDAASFDGSALAQSVPLARRVLEAARVDAAVARGQGNAIGFCAGRVFQLERPPAGGPKTTEFLLTRVVHIGGIGGGDGYAYENQFECIERARAFRPARRTPKPRVHGVQTGLVIGKGTTDEIHTDALGRVRVAFPLHRHGDSEEHSSCWIRVAQIWAGPGYGSMVIPRVGMEVVVAFVDGDPDRPLITGCVYNGTNSPPYELPEQMSKSTFKSASTPGSDSFNEVRFEDADGREQVFVRAQRRMDLRVQGTLFETCAGNREEIVGGDDPYAEADGMHNLLVRGESNSIVQNNVFESVGGRVHRSITQEMVEESFGGRIIWENRRFHVTSPEIVVESSGNISQKSNVLNLAGSEELSIMAGEKVVIESNNALELRVGKNFVSISQGGIDIQGLVLGLNSGGGAGHASNGLDVEGYEIEEPLEALPADDGRIHTGSGGGGGARSRTHNKQKRDPFRAPDMRPPRPLPKPTDPKSPADNSGTWVNLWWKQTEAWCSDPVMLMVKANHPSADEAAYVRDASDGELVAGVAIPARDGLFEQPVKLCDILPRKLHDGLEESREFDAWLSTGLYSSNSITLRFISNLPEMGYYEGRAMFVVHLREHSVEISSDIPYVRGMMGYRISLGDLAPDDARGFIGVEDEGFTDWRWCKKVEVAGDPNRLAYWDGRGWRIVPKEFDSAHGTKLFGVAIWREGGEVLTSTGQIPWPDSLEEWAPESVAALEQKKVEWADAIRSYWSEKYDLKREQCAGHDPKCCRYAIHCNVRFHEVDSRVEHGIVIGENVTRENSRAWSFETSNLTAAHEFGHHLGNPDEYEGGSSVDVWVNGDGALFGIDEQSIMNDGKVVRRRHVETIAKAVARLVEQETGESFTYVPVEHLA